MLLSSTLLALAVIILMTILMFCSFLLELYSVCPLCVCRCKSTSEHSVLPLSPSLTRPVAVQTDARLAKKKKTVEIPGQDAVADADETRQRSSCQCQATNAPANTLNSISRASTSASASDSTRLTETDLCCLPERRRCNPCAASLLSRLHCWARPDRCNEFFALKYFCFGYFCFPSSSDLA